MTTIKTIAVFHAFASRVCAWSVSDGIVDALARMGYAVMDCGRPPRITVNLDQLKCVDLIILSGPEIFWSLVERWYPHWSYLKMPKAAWYTESAHRDDRDFDFGALKHIADRHYYPAAQDAEEFGGTWLPFGVDTEMFRPKRVSEKSPAAFIGNVYPKRRQFAEAITFNLDHVIPAQSTKPRQSFEHLADAYSSIEIFVNMPSYSRLLVTKVTEARACGCMVLTPVIDHPSAGWNLTQFENGEHLVYYNPERPGELGDIIEHFRKHPERREEIASAGLQEILKNHRLETRLRRIIEDAEGTG